MNSNPGLNLIWAQAANGVIGAGGGMPWDVPEDLAHFKRQTWGNPVIMGRKTWESFPEKVRPLPGRANMVITRDLAEHDQLRASGAIPAASPDEALNAALALADAKQIWVVGGGEVYTQFLSMADMVIRTVINAEPDGDTIAPELDTAWVLDSEPGNWLRSVTGTQYRFERWVRNPE